MYVVKTALRESFCTIHVGFSYNNTDKDIKIETDQGKIGGGEREITKCLILSKPLHDRISALGVMHVLPQEYVVRLLSTLLLKDIVSH